MGDQYRRDGDKWIVLERNFSTRDDVQAFIAEHGKHELLRSYEDNLLHTDDVPLVEAWLSVDQQRAQRETAERGAAIEAERLELERRNTAAAERSAEAARQSAKWAGWAIAMSLLAIVVSVFSLLYART